MIEGLEIQLQDATHDQDEKAHELEVKTQTISLVRFCHQVSLKKWKIDRLNDHQKNKNGLGELRSEKSFLFPHHKICDVYNGAQLKAHQLPPLVCWGQLFSKLRPTEIFGKF